MVGGCGRVRACGRVRCGRVAGCRARGPCRHGSLSRRSTPCLRHRSGIATQHAAVATHPSVAARSPVASLTLATHRMPRASTRPGSQPGSWRLGTSAARLGLISTLPRPEELARHHRRRHSRADVPPATPRRNRGTVVASSHKTSPVLSVSTSHYTLGSACHRSARRSSAVPGAALGSATRRRGARCWHRNNE